MLLNQIFKLGTAAILLFLASQCGESTFNSTAAKKDDRQGDAKELAIEAASVRDQEGGHGGDARAGDEGVGEGGAKRNRIGTGSDQSGGGGDGGVTDTGVDSADGSSNQGSSKKELGLETDSGKKTFCTKDGIIRIVLVFDVSASQSNGDLRDMRDGANQLVTAARTFLTVPDSPDVRMAVVYFNATAGVGINKWVSLADAIGEAKIRSDIDAATADDSGRTSYNAAFKKVVELYAMEATDEKKLHHRNLVFFYSDGKPNVGGSRSDDQDEAAAVAAAGSLSRTKGVATVAIATSNSNKALQSLSKLALPSAGVVAPDHTGAVFVADSGEEVITSFAARFQKIIDPCSK